MQFSTVLPIAMAFVGVQAVPSNADITTVTDKDGKTWVGDASVRYLYIFKFNSSLTNMLGRINCPRHCGPLRLRT